MSHVKLILYNHCSGRLCFIASVISAVGSVIGAKKAADASKTNAREANAFTKEQLQKRHQWEVADLRAAGLNPVLSAGGTPSIGNSAMAQAFNPADNIGNMVNSAIGVEKLQQEIKNMKAEERRINSDTRLKNKQGNVQDNIDRTTNVLAEAGDAIIGSLGSKGLGANSGKSVGEKAGSLFKDATSFKRGRSALNPMSWYDIIKRKKGKK